MYNIKNAYVVGMAVLLLSACHPAPEKGHLAAEPHTRPVKTITSFNEALHCMDNLFLANGRKDIYITSSGIPDATGQISAGTKEMLITAIATMSSKSEAFRFVDYDPNQVDVLLLGQISGIQKGFFLPSYYIRGAITQLDNGVVQSSQGAAVTTPYGSLAASSDEVMSIMAVDLNIGDFAKRQVIPGMSTSNSIAVVKTGNSGDVGGIMDKLSLSISLNKSEGLHQAVRNLIELSTIEVLGKLTKTPYWQCLEIDQTSPTYRAEAHDWFESMGKSDRIRYAKTSLAGSGYYSGAIDDIDDKALHDSVARYQSEHDLIASGQLDADLYYKLMSQPNGEAHAAPTPAPAPSPPPPAAASAPTIELIELRTSQEPQHHVKDKLVVQATAKADGFLYCYYQDADNTVSRIFPNRFQPNAFVNSGQSVKIPPEPNPPFTMSLDKKGTEGIACLISSFEIGLKLPDRLKAKELETLPVKSLDDIIGVFKELGGTAWAGQRLSIDVY